MARILFALSLALFAAGASAGEAPPSASDDAGCPKVEQATAKADAAETSKPENRPGAAAPVRARSSGSAGRTTPRWNTMLPGMIRSSP